MDERLIDLDDILVVNAGESDEIHHLFIAYRNRGIEGIGASNTVVVIKAQIGELGCTLDIVVDLVFGAIDKEYAGNQWLKQPLILTANELPDIVHGAIGIGIKRIGGNKLISLFLATVGGANDPPLLVWV